MKCVKPLKGADRRIVRVENDEADRLVARGTHQFKSKSEWKAQNKADEIAAKEGRK